MGHKWIWRLIVLCALVLVGLYGYGITAAVHHGDVRAQVATRNQAVISSQLNELRQQLDTLEAENKALEKAATAAQTQANTSVGQLTAAGKTPIIAAPGVVTVSTTPSTTTTERPTVVTVPVPETPTSGTPDTTTTTTTTTEPPTTTTTTTTVPPDTTTTTSTVAPDTTTTTIGTSP